MDLFGVAEMSMERTWKVSAGEVKLGEKAFKHSHIGITPSGLALSHHS